MQGDIGRLAFLIGGEDQAEQRGLSQRAGRGRLAGQQAAERAEITTRVRHVSSTATRRRIHRCCADGPGYWGSLSGRPKRGKTAGVRNAVMATIWLPCQDSTSRATGR